MQCFQPSTTTCQKMDLTPLPFPHFSHWESLPVPGFSIHLSMVVYSESLPAHILPNPFHIPKSYSHGLLTSIPLILLFLLYPQLFFASLISSIFYTARNDNPILPLLEILNMQGNVWPRLLIVVSIHIPSITLYLWSLPRLPLQRHLHISVDSNFYLNKTFNTNLSYV